MSVCELKAMTIPKDNAMIIMSISSVNTRAIPRSRRLAEAEEIVEAALPAATGVVRSRLLQLLGWIDVRRENYAAAAPAFTAALEALEEADDADLKGRARILNALGIIAAETIDLRLGRLVRRQYHACAWSEDTRIERFFVLEAAMRAMR